MQVKRPGEVQTAILRRHLLELTESFIIPLERYMSTLMPLKKNISPYKVTWFLIRISNVLNYIWKHFQQLLAHVGDSYGTSRVPHDATQWYFRRCRFEIVQVEVFHSCTWNWQFGRIHPLWSIGISLEKLLIMAVSGKRCQVVNPSFRAVAKKQKINEMCNVLAFWSKILWIRK